MLNVKKILTKILKSLAVIENLGTGVTLIRVSNLRILCLNHFQGANSTLTIPTADRPSSPVSAPTLRMDENNRSTAMGYMTVNASNGYVQRYYAGTYNAAGSGVSNIGATDRSSGIIAWIVGGGTT